MPDPVIFLGAGASAPFGIPTMKELVGSFESELSQSTDVSSGERDLYSSVTQTLREGFDYVDLESVFSVIKAIAENKMVSDLGFASAYFLHNKGVNLRSGLASGTAENEAAKALQTRFQRHIRRKCVVDENQLGHIDDVYFKFFEALGRVFGGNSSPLNGKQYRFGDWAFYTTNYDTVFEKYAEGVLPLNDLFEDEGTLRAVLHTNKVPQNGLKLIKLHGSIDWYRLSDSRVIRNPIQLKVMGRRQVEGEEMLYPIQQKDLYLYPWYDMFGGLKRDLNAASHWIIIGYSFNDEFIADVFKQALTTGPRKITFVHPDADGIWPRKFGNLANHARLIRSKFGEDETNKEIESSMR
jgi:hypothetical protein